MIEFDNILNEIGRMTRPQWIQLSLLILPSIISPWHMGAMVFIGAEQPHMCDIPMKDMLIEECGRNWTDEQTKKYIPWDKETDTFDSCKRYIVNDINCSYWWPNTAGNISQSTVNTTKDQMEVTKCSTWTYDTSVFKNTIVDEFDLVCGQKYQRRLSQAIFMLGVTIGSAIWGQVSDRFGRKVGIVVPLIIGFIFAISTAFVQSFVLFTVLRFFVGSCVFPAFAGSFVLGTETVKPKYRVWVGQTAQAFFALGFCIFALIGYYVRTWRFLQLFITVPIGAVVLILWFLFESPRWLISSKKYVVAQRIVKKIMESGKNLHSAEAEKLDNIVMMQKGMKEPEKIEELRELNGHEKETRSEKVEIEEPKKTYSIIDVLKLPNMRRKSLIMFYEWMVASCMYYGLTLNAADMGGDPFINFFLSGLVEIPACYLTIVLLQKWGRRPTLVFTPIFGGIACMCMMFIPKDLLWLNIILSMSGKFSASAAFGTVYIYATEIYPTPVRNVGIGVCSSWARIGGILAPFIAMLDAVAFPLPYVVFGLLSMIGGFLAFLLPEVLGIKLPETLQEGEAFGKKLDSPLAVICCKTDQNGSEGNEVYDKMIDMSKNSNSSDM